MENIVYILGAGFSAPLGLPVMSNFISMAKDLYERDKKKYQHFVKVLEKIRKELAYVAWIYKSDLDNIEEILSILVMANSVGKVSKKEVSEYVSFILDVIKFYTPTINGLSSYENIAPGNYRVISRDVEGEKNILKSLIDNNYMSLYGEFVRNLFNGQIKSKGIGEPIDQYAYKDFEIQWIVEQNPIEKYSIITFNYDLILENLADYFTKVSGTKIKFLRPGDKKIKGIPYLVKLHGSLETGKIVPPTWNKSLTPDIELEWKKAYELLSTANQIRIIGYSLPPTDSYVRYLLKASVLKSENLKRIDVICMNNNNVKENY